MGYELNKENEIKLLEGWKKAVLEAKMFDTVQGLQHQIDQLKGIIPEPETKPQSFKVLRKSKNRFRHH
jgi:hypothetical protein